MQNSDEMLLGRRRRRSTIMSCEYRFVIEAYNSNTIPISRLAEYMADLARQSGEPDCVHFMRLE